MRPLRIGLAVVTFSVGMAIAAPVPPERKKLPSYHPTQKGTKWVYLSDDDGEVMEATDVITAVEDKDGAKVVHVDRLVRWTNIHGQAFDDTIPIWTLRVSEKGLFQIKSGVDKIDPPPCLLKLPVKQGEKWEVDHFHPGFGKRRKGTLTVAGIEKVKVPAGTYTAVRVDWDYTLGGQRKRMSQWFAPDVGIIKVKGQDRKELVLKSLTPGKE